MLALLDSDTPVYECALASENVELKYAQSRLDSRISSIIHDSGASDYKLFVSGEGNFRKEICPLYKANRTREDPRWREDLRLHLIREWGAVECNGYEADDACGINQGSDTIICGIDKDLLQIPGRHFQWAIIRKGAVAREAREVEISEESGWRNLFTQALTGDTSDNIKGIQGIGAVKAADALKDCKTEDDFYDVVQFFYTSSLMVVDVEEGERRLQRNLDLLYIWRSLGITYSIRREINGI